MYVHFRTVQLNDEGRSPGDVNRHRLTSFARHRVSLVPAIQRCARASLPKSQYAEPTRSVVHYDSATSPVPTRLATAYHRNKNSQNPFMSAVPSTLQSFPYAAGVQAIKECQEFGTFDEFYQHLVENLPQNSPQTRKRFASLIVRWFFPDRALDGLLPRTWATYHDEQLLADLMRVTTLEVEPVLGRFVVDVVLPFEPGVQFPAELARDYIIGTYHEYKKDSYDRLLVAMRSLGYLSRLRGEWIVNAIPTPADALLILLHTRLAPTPRIVRISDLLEQSLIKFLGFRDPEDVRQVLRAASTAGLLARYSVVDQLEQVTTRLSADEYFAARTRL